MLWLETAVHCWSTCILMLSPIRSERLESQYCHRSEAKDLKEILQSIQSERLEVNIVTDPK